MGEMRETWAELDMKRRSTGNAATSISIDGVVG
jgi:hypothetical protein